MKLLFLVLKERWDPLWCLAEISEYYWLLFWEIFVIFIQLWLFFNAQCEYIVETVETVVIIIYHLIFSKLQIFSKKLVQACHNGVIQLMGSYAAT